MMFKEPKQQVSLGRTSLSMWSGAPEGVLIKMLEFKLDYNFVSYQDYTAEAHWDGIWDFTL